MRQKCDGIQATPAAQFGAPANEFHEARRVKSAVIRRVAGTYRTLTLVVF
jgi:hypothetical protein